MPRVSVDRRYVFREFAEPALYPSAVDSKIAFADLRSRVESNGRSTIRTIEKPHYDRVREAKVHAALYISVGQRCVIGFGKRHAGLRGNHLREHKPQFVSGDRIEPRRNGLRPRPLPKEAECGPVPREDEEQLKASRRRPTARRTDRSRA